MDDIGHHTPDFNVGAAGHLNGVVFIVLGHQPCSPLFLADALQGEFSLDDGHDNIVVLHVHAAVNDQLVTVMDAGTNHAVTADTYHKRGLAVVYKILVGVQYDLEFFRCKLQRGGDSGKEIWLGDGGGVAGLDDGEYLVAHSVSATSRTG